MAPDQFWQEFLQTSGLPRETRYYECFHFELSELLANKLLALVLSGEKRATASSLFLLKRKGYAFLKWAITASLRIGPACHAASSAPRL